MIEKVNSLSAFFHDEVGRALEDSKVDATPAVRVYIVDMLVGFASPDPEILSAMSTPLIFSLDEARHASGHDRARKLRAVGDSVLYVSGFFADHVAGTVDRGYATRIGSVAYGGVAEALGPSRPAPTFSELSVKFGRLVSVLSEVAERSNARQAHGDSGLVSLYERWFKTGSPAVAAELASRGVTAAAARGVH